MNHKSNFLRGLITLSFFSLMAALATTGFTSCNQHNENTMIPIADSGSVIPAPVADTTQLKEDWEKFKADAREKIKQSDDSIATLKKRISKFDRKMKLKYDKDVAQIERKNDTLKIRLDNYRQEGKDKWEDFKIHFNHDMNEVKTWLKDSTVLTN
jgi:hypothetical protein